MQSLRPLQWVMSPIIDAYGVLIESEAENICVTSTKFYTGINGDRLPAQAQANLMEDARNVIMPVNLDNRHWLCVYIDRQAHRIKVYDSNGNVGG